MFQRRCITSMMKKMGKQKNWFNRMLKSNCSVYFSSVSRQFRVLRRKKVIFIVIITFHAFSRTSILKCFKCTNKPKQRKRKEEICVLHLALSETVRAAIVQLDAHFWKCHGSVEVLCKSYLKSIKTGSSAVMDGSHRPYSGIDVKFYCKFILNMKLMELEHHFDTIFMYN